ncbi:DUF6985 domain-containing protein [Pseudobacteroides cellulosolvens]|uniref:DUF6985 domain-containing protein n=1 Tax=Pseudobacteroides cellulosolvens ATCC 35603 = DSM 2933 TaxID=398512 RepID=A0A0L6JKQ1_9FIRM|nr:hypothetical protein [Pseudobacteroides cellulosolvens]KNY26364.1 hypothetical protein Bccel_1626 [Pseudobacteroides cellulosolvens ATCC 35603 = DSM 2933]
MQDELFGHLEYDYLWQGKIEFFIFNQNNNITLSIECEDEDEDITDVQRKSMVEFAKNKERIIKEIETKIFNYYQSICPLKREKRVADIDKIAPIIHNVDEVGSLVKPVNFYIKNSDERTIAILFECTWDFDLGVGVEIVNEEVIRVGVQNDVM